MENEIFKDIPGYEGLYQVSNLGNVKSLINFNGTKERILKPQKDKDGYFNITLHKDKKLKTHSIHRLVGLIFLEKIDGKNIINHIDGNKQNNQVKNLEWCTTSENQIHKFKVLGYKNHFHLNHPKTSLGKFGKDNPGSKTVNQYDLNGNFIKTWDSMRDITRELQISQGSISYVCKGKRKMAGNFIFKYI